MAMLSLLPFERLDVPQELSEDEKFTTIHEKCKMVAKKVEYLAEDMRTTNNFTLKELSDIFHSESTKDKMLEDDSNLESSVRIQRGI